MPFLPTCRTRRLFLASLPGALLVTLSPSCTEPAPSGSATQQSPARADTVAVRHRVLGADCGLFPAAARLPTDEQGLAPPNRGRFTPTLPQVASVELSLRTLPLHRVPTVPGFRVTPRYPLLIHQNLPRYKRQYFGFYNLQRQPCLYLNLFAEHIDEYPGYTPRWLREIIQVEDGGAGYWSIKYNLTTRQFYEFAHNYEG